MRTFLSWRVIRIGVCSAALHGLGKCAAVALVGSRGDSHDNALAEAFNSLYKTELTHYTVPWTGLLKVEATTAAYVE